MDPHQSEVNKLKVRSSSFTLATNNLQNNNIFQERAFHIRHQSLRSDHFMLKKQSSNSGSDKPMPEMKMVGLSQASNYTPYKSHNTQQQQFLSQFRGNNQLN